MNKSLELFCLCFFSYYQIILIFQCTHTFDHLLQSDFNITSIGKMSTILGMILNVMILTSAMKSVYDSLLVVKEKIQEKLLVTFDKEDRQHLKFLLEKVKLLGPVNACGYFEITNSTLTSMLGVR